MTARNFLRTKAAQRLLKSQSRTLFWPAYLFKIATITTLLIAFVLRRSDRVASIIVNANQKLGSVLIDTVGFLETVHPVPKRI